MILTAKRRIIPTPEQELLFRKSAGVARWAYNYFLYENKRLYEEYLANGKTGPKSISGGAVTKYINNVLKPSTHQWLSGVGCNVMKQGVKDADTAMKRFYKSLSKFPKPKSKKNSDLSFYVNYETLKSVNGGFRGERLGFVRTSEPLPKLPKGKKYSNPRIKYDGKYWYLTVGYEVEESSEPLSDESLGIDLGIKSLAVCSNGNVYENINKTQEVRRLKKKLKREQRKLSRKLEANTKCKTAKGKPIYDRPLEECKNYQKQKHKIAMINRHLTNIRDNHIHQTTSELVKTKPFRVVMEDLNVSGMMKNRHLSKAVQEQKFYTFRTIMEYKCKLHGIGFVLVDRFFPSSKMCSCCGTIKKNLKLSDRTYTCEGCGLVIDRDLNASINLAHYNL